jgi:hypothetical protein
MKASDCLDATWDAIAQESKNVGGIHQRRLPIECCCSVHAGIHWPTDARIIILDIDPIAVSENRLEDETKGYSITVGVTSVDGNGRAGIYINEVNQLYRDLFKRFCADIIDSWTAQIDSVFCVNALLETLARWKRFFQRIPNTSLTREDYIGLFGEISFIEDWITQCYSAETIVNAWQGPLGSNQDFQSGSIAIEVKTITSNNSEVIRISNVRQLDSIGLEALFLVRYAFDFRNGHGRRLLELIASVRKSLEGSCPKALSVFNDRLFEAGFLDSTPNEFDGWGFSLRHYDVFHVVDGFPRLLEDNLQKGISDVSYSINLSAAQKYLICKQKMMDHI